MKTTMKNLLIIVIMLAIIASMTACIAKVTAKTKEEATEQTTEETTEETEEEILEPEEEETMNMGGWEKNGSMEITDEIRSLVEKAAAGKLGVNYTPVAYLSHQIVAGTNHKILCKIAPVTPDAAQTYAIITIYEDLEGNAEITEVLNCEAGIVGIGLLGGWTEAEVPTRTEASVNALEKAMENLVGANYEEVCCLATQLVSGTNYSLLCEITPVVPNAESHFAIVNVCEDLNGNARVTEVFDFFAAE